MYLKFVFTKSHLSLFINVPTYEVVKLMVLFFSDFSNEYDLEV